MIGKICDCAVYLFLPCLAYFLIQQVFHLFQHIFFVESTENELSKIVFDLGIKVHKVLSPVYWKVHMKNVNIMKSINMVYLLKSKKHYHLSMKILKWELAIGFKEKAKFAMSSAKKVIAPFS